VYIENTASATFLRCTFSQNTADYGGAVHAADSSDPTFVACRFTGNKAAVSGGAIYCSTFGTSPRFLDCVVTGNLSLGDGGGAYARMGSPSFRRCTVAGNSASARGGGLAVRGPAIAGFEGGILWGDAAALGAEIALIDDAALGGATLVVDYSDAQGGAAAAFVEPASALVVGPGVLDADPLFLDLAAGDVRLPAGSPAVDAGAPLEPLDPAFPYDVLGFGHPRLDDGDFDGLAIVDQGAVEFGGLLSPGEVAGGSTAHLVLSGPGGALYGVAIGAPGAPIDLGAAGTIFLAAAPLTVVASGALPGAGTATVLSAIAPIAAIGTAAHFQAGTIAFGVLKLSNLESLAIVAP
jgi:predicted outer membrane repeat protein